MSNSNDYRKYARRRKFEYPDDYQDEQDDDSYSAPHSMNRNRTGNMNRGGRNARFASENRRTSSRSRDPYAEEAELYIQNGDVSSALEALASSITECENINSIKRLGELLFAIFLEIYGEKGLDGRDDQGMGLAEGVIGSFFLYMTLKSALENELSPEEEQELQGYFEQTAVLFHDIRDFNDICDLVKVKIESSDIHTFIYKILHGGF